MQTKGQTGRINETDVEVDVIMTISVRTRISVDNDAESGIVEPAFEQLGIHDRMKSFKGWIVDDFQVFLT